MSIGAVLNARSLDVYCVCPCVTTMLYSLHRGGVCSSEGSFVSVNENKNWNRNVNERVEWNTYWAFRKAKEHEALGSTRDWEGYTQNYLRVLPNVVII